MLSTHFARTNQLPGFSKSGALPAPNMRNTDRYYYLKSGLEAESKLIHFGTS